MNLFDFIFNTIRKRANDKNNQRFWLPGVLQDVKGSNSKGKLLPLELNSWDVGEISGDGGITITQSFASQYASYLESVKKADLSSQVVIAYPSTPSPKLSFLDATVLGLHNLWIMEKLPSQSGEDGYKANISMQIDYYDGTRERPSLPLLSLSGNYILSQSFCTADKNIPNLCNRNYNTDINGQGFVIAEITNAVIEATVLIKVSGTGKDRIPTVVLTDVKLRNRDNDDYPDLKIKKLEIVARVSKFLRNVWITMSERALTSPDGRQGIFEQINNSLNQADTLSKLSEMLTTQFAIVLDSIIGVVTPEALSDDSGQKLTNPVDLYLFDRMRYALNNPVGQWYLPKTILNFTDPPLEPLKINAISLPDQKILTIKIKQVQLLNVMLTGLSNILAPAGQLLFSDDASLDATVNVSALNAPPVENNNGKVIPAPPLTATGIFSFLPDGTTTPLSGGFTLKVASSQLHFSTSLGGDDESSLQVNLESVRISASPSEIKVTLGIGAIFKEAINNIVNQPGILNHILDEINRELEKNLAAISGQVTNAARSGIAARLDN